MAKKTEIDTKTLNTLAYQLLETEVGGVSIYEKALECVVNDDLREEWTEYLEQTREHVKVARRVVEALGLDPDDKNGPGRKIVRMHAATLIEMMSAALEESDPGTAELVACECVVTAETKDHMNWSLLEHAMKGVKGEAGAVLKDAYEQVEDEEDEHIYHSKGWARELWIKALGLPAELPPPEERKDVKTAIGAERAKKARKPSARPPS